MVSAAVAVGGVLVTAALLLFLGGMVSAFRENRAEKRETGRVTRPGWSRPKNRPGYVAPPNYTAPGATNFYVWPLTLVGRPDLAARLLERRAAKRATS